MTTPAPDWADDIANKHERLSKLDRTLFAAALRAAYERGKADGERLGYIKGLREAVDICDGNTQPRSEIRARIAELEQEADAA